MMLTPLTNTRNVRHRRSWLSTSGAACLSTPILCAMSVQQHSAAPHNVLAARPNPDPNASVLARLKALPALRITYTPEPASKSP
jgi:hypothetical protein